MAKKSKKAQTLEEERPTKAALDERGHEVVDSRPLSTSLGIRRSPTLAEQIKNAVRSDRLAQEAASAGMETFEEADDFDIGDDYDPESPYENEFEPPGPPPSAGDPRNAPAQPEPTPQTPPPSAPPEPALAPPGAGVGGAPLVKPSTP